MSMRGALFVLVTAMAGCGDDGKSPGDGGGGESPGLMPPDAPDGRTVVAVIPATPNRDLDLLFVIDDSPSMLDKQDNLVNNFPNFINVLNQAPGGLPNLHLGVITTDVGTRATEDAQPGPTIGSVGVGGCAGSGKAGNLQAGMAGTSLTGNFLSDVDDGSGTRVRNYTGTLAEVFGQMAHVGAGGCGFEQPLQAMQLALSANAADAGFLRQDAMLGVVFLTDEDDCSVRHTSMLGPESATLGPLQSFRCTRFGVTCSTGGTTADEMNQIGPKSGCTGSTGSPFMTDVAPFATFLAGVKGDTRKLVVGAIMAPPNPIQVEGRIPPGSSTAIPALAHSCQYQGAMNLEVGDPGVRLQDFLDHFHDTSTFATVCQADLSVALAQIAQLVSRGIGAPCISVPLATPASCVVTDSIPGGSTTTIPMCTGTPSPPCWRLETDAAHCTLADHEKLVIERSQAPDAATVTEMRCAL